MMDMLVRSPQPHLSNTSFDKSSVKAKMVELTAKVRVLTSSG